MTTQIPYFVELVFPDERETYMKTVCGNRATLDSIRLEIEKHIYEYIVELCGVEELQEGYVNSYEDIENMVYCEFGMKNPCINVMYFKDNSWTKMDIDYGDLLKRLRQIANNRA